MIIDSFTRRNKYRFNCPAVERAAAYSECQDWLNDYMRGRYTRAPNDCLACMAANKCPASHMVHEEVKAKRSLYFSTADKISALSKEIVERIANVIVLPFHTARFNLSDEEKAAIEMRNERAPAHENNRGEEPGSKKSKRSKKRKKDALDLDSGSYADVVNKMAKQESSEGDKGRPGKRETPVESHSTPKKEHAPEREKPTPKKAGLSMLERAKQMRARREQEKRKQV